MKGRFICIEGLDGSGTTTQTKLLVEKLTQRGYPTVPTAEPTNGRIGKLVKEYCLHNRKRVSTIIEALLFAADRFEHIEKEVIPALSKGKIVVSDRCVYSSLAYQGAAGLDLEWIGKINEHALRPDLAIFIDVDPEIAMMRLKPRRSVMENLETQKQVKKTYSQFIENGELVGIEGNRSIDEVSDDIFKVVVSFLES